MMAASKGVDKKALGSALKKAESKDKVDDKKMISSMMKREKGVKN